MVSRTSSCASVPLVTPQDSSGSSRSSRALSNASVHAGVQLPGHMPLRRTSIWSAIPACRSRPMSSSVSSSRVNGGRSPRRWSRARISCGGSATWLSVSRRSPAADWNRLTSALVGTAFFRELLQFVPAVPGRFLFVGAQQGDADQRQSGHPFRGPLRPGGAELLAHAGDDAVDLLLGRREDLVGRQAGRGVAREGGPAFIEPGQVHAPGPLTACRRPTAPTTRRSLQQGLGDLVDALGDTGRVLLGLVALPQPARLGRHGPGLVKDGRSATHPWLLSPISAH